MVWGRRGIRDGMGEFRGRDCLEEVKKRKGGSLGGHGIGRRNIQLGGEWTITQNEILGLKEGSLN